MSQDMLTEKVMTAQTPRVQQVKRTSFTGLPVELTGPYRQQLPIQKCEAVFGLSTREH